MAITKRDQQELDQLHAEYGPTYKGAKEDYFALVYLTRKFDLRVEEAVSQVAFGGNDYGIDAYHFDREGRNLYLYQFKWSENHNLFKDSMDRIADDGIARIFGDPLQDPEQNELVAQLKADLEEHQKLIDRVYIHFVFKGDGDAAENSEGLQARREKLASRKWIIKEYFKGRDVDVKDAEFIADRRHPPRPQPSDTYAIAVAHRVVSTEMPDGNKRLHVGFVPLMDLYRIHKALGQTFLNRNIRAGLSAENPPNKRIREALSSIVMKAQEPPEVFSFNHNGITLAADKVEFEDGRAILKVPRLLNGAQTITSLDRFLEDNDGNPALKANTKRLEAIQVLTKIVEHNPLSDFVKVVTISNNQQNPVDPWNLRANDEIQCDLQDRFKEQLGLYYSRQENSFQGLTDSDLAEMGIEDTRRDIRIKLLAQTFLAAQGELDRMSRLREVFDNQKFYTEAFKESYLHSDPRRIVLAYKVNLVLNSPMQELDERAPVKLKYAVSKARNLVWALLIQALLNDPKLSAYLEGYGDGLQKESDFRQLMRKLASSRVLPILKAVLNDESYQQKIEDEKYSFLRTKELFRRSMDDAYDRFGWTKKPL
jgi:hypothetical protein